MIEVKIVKNEELGLWEGTATLNLPTVTVTKFKARKDDLKYEFQSEFQNLVSEYIEKNMDGWFPKQIVFLKNIMIESNVVKDPELNCWKATLKLELPPIVVIKVESEKRNLQRSLTREVTDIVSEYLEKNLEF